MLRNKLFKEILINMSETQTQKIPTENFEDLLNETSFAAMSMVGNVVKGIVLDVNEDFVLVDVGLKSEGRVPVREFAPGNTPLEIKRFDEVEVFIERMEDKDGLIVLSHEKARREAAWGDLEKAHRDETPVTGKIFGRVKGGFTVDLDGPVAFLPASQLDVRLVKDIDNSLMNIEQPFMILKMDRSRGNIVVSRRAILEESRSGMREEVLSKIEEGLEVEGVVKNITEYGAFVDLGGVDGLLHITDMSWSRLNHPSELIQLGQTIKVQVVRYNRDSGRISLGMKQLEKDPWDGLPDRYKTGVKITGKVTNIADYGAFVEIEPGVEGLIHVSEMSWTKKNIHPGKLLTSGHAVEVVILEVDSTKRRIALGLKQASSNPWSTIVEDFPQGSEFEGEVKNITEFGLFVSVNKDIDGMVHMSDLSWTESPDEAIKNYKVGSTVKVKVIEIDPDKERIALSIKALEKDPFVEALGSVKKGDLVTCEITKVIDAGLEVIVNELSGFIKKSDLGRDRADQRADRFAVGEKVDARVILVDRKNRSVNLSIKAREIAEEKEVMATYGSTDSGASLGDILGAALDKAKISASDVTQGAVKAGTKIKEEVKAAVDDPAGTVKAAAKKAKDIIEEGAHKAEELGEKAVDAVKDVLESESAETAKKTVKKTAAKAAEAGEEALETLEKGVDKATKKVKEVVKKATNKSDEK